VRQRRRLLPKTAYEIRQLLLANPAAAFTIRVLAQRRQPRAPESDVVAGSYPSAYDDLMTPERTIVSSIMITTSDGA
jgi:hypothetical protein